MLYYNGPDELPNEGEASWWRDHCTAPAAAPATRLVRRRRFAICETAKAIFQLFWFWHAIPQLSHFHEQRKSRGRRCDKLESYLDQLYSLDFLCPGAKKAEDPGSCSVDLDCRKRFRQAPSYIARTRVRWLRQWV